jgi:hypothetical protein
MLDVDIASYYDEIDRSCLRYTMKTHRVFFLGSEMGVGEVGG